MTTDTCDTGAAAGAGAVPGTNANGEDHPDVPLLTDGVENAAATATSAGQNPTDSMVSFDSVVLGKNGENDAAKEPFRTGQSLATSGVAFDDIINEPWFCNLLNNHPDAAGTLLFGMGLDCSELLGTAWFQNLRTSSDPAAFGRFCQGFLRPKSVPASTNYGINSSSSSIGDKAPDNKPTTTSNTSSLTGTSSADTTVKAKLPATTLASVLDFMEYGDVRRILCTGKYVAVDAAKHIKTINITRVCQLFTGPMTKSVTRIFANVKEVNCLCLVRIDVDGDQVLSIEAATRIVPFLMTFPKLSSAFVGGAGPGGRFEYDAERFGDHRGIFRRLANDIRAAILAGILPSRLELQGGLQIRRNTALPSLPAVVYGHVMNFMEYRDVRLTILASKIMANDATKHVHTLNIMRPTELTTGPMTSPLTRRFPNVTDVNCFCLVEEISGDLSQHLSTETARLIVPFLMTLPKLSSAFIGGKASDGGIEYDVGDCNSPGHEKVFRDLIDHFCGAFENGTLPNNLDLQGILAIRRSYDTCYLGIMPKKFHCAIGGECHLCRRVCSSFPFSVVVKLEAGESMCVPDHVRISALRDRPGSTALFHSGAALDGLIRVLESHIGIINMRLDCKNLGDRDFVRRMQEERGERVQSNTHVQVYRLRLNDQSMECLRASLASGLDLTLASASRTKLMASGHCFSEAQTKMIWLRSSFDFLVALGFDFVPSDFVLVDPSTEPCFRQHLQRAGSKIWYCAWN